MTTGGVGYLADKELSYRGTSLIRTAHPLGLLSGPRHGPSIGSKAAAVSYERGTPVMYTRCIRVRGLGIHTRLTFAFSQNPLSEGRKGIGHEVVTRLSLKARVT
jgi:hypothetical protein